MRGFVFVAAVLCSSYAFAEGDVALSSTSQHRSANLLGGLELDSSYKLSTSPALALSDDLRFSLMDAPAALDQGGGLSSDLRQILALILGFVPGFGIGHLIAHDRDGFVLFLIIDIALYVLWGTVGWIVWHPFGYVGGLIWLVVHIIQALDAYAEAGGERIVQRMREQAVEFARTDLDVRPDVPAITTRVFALTF